MLTQRQATHATVFHFGTCHAGELTISYRRVGPTIHDDKGMEWQYIPVRSYLTNERKNITRAEASEFHTILNCPSIVGRLSVRP